MWLKDSKARYQKTLCLPSGCISIWKLILHAFCKLQFRTLGWCYSWQLADSAKFVCYVLQPTCQTVLCPRKVDLICRYPGRDCLCVTRARGDSHLHLIGRVLTRLVQTLLRHLGKWNHPTSWHIIGKDKTLPLAMTSFFSILEYWKDYRPGFFCSKGR